MILKFLQKLYHKMLPFSALQFVIATNLPFFSFIVCLYVFFDSLMFFEPVPV